MKEGIGQPDQLC